MKKLGYLFALIPLCILFILGGCGGKTTPSVTLDKATLSLTVGEEAVLTVTTEKCADFTVETSDGAVVTVTKSEDGFVTVKALAAGEATVTVKGIDEEGTALAEKTCSVTVASNPIKINLPTGKLVLRKNRTATVKAFVSVDYTDDPVWESSDEEIATVEFQGLTAIVTALQTGECTITLTIGEMTQSFTVVCGVK